MIKQPDVMVVLLQGGQEVIATVEDTGAGSIRLSRPQKIIAVPLPMQTPQGIACQFLMQMVPLMSGAIRDWVALKANDYIGEPMTPNPQLKDNYLQLTTGIQIAH